MNDDYEDMIQRRIEHLKWAPEIFKEMMSELGETEAVAIAQRALIKNQENLAREIAAKYGQTFEGFKRWQHYAAAKNPYHTFSDEGDDFIQLKILRCPSWDALNRLGLPRLCRTYCSTDSAMSQAFSPKLHYHVARQISAGDDSCDAGWTWKE